MLAAEERRIDARFVLSVVACGIMSFAGVVVETAMNITATAPAVGPSVGGLIVNV